MVTVRPAGAGDAAAILGLRREWGSERGQHEVEGYEAAAAAWLDEAAGSRDVWVAEVDVAVAGFVTVLVCRRMPWPGGPGGEWGYVNHMYVSAVVRGRGVGTSLLTGVVDACRARGFERLVVNPSLPSVSFWRRAGFTDPPSLLQLDL